MLLYTQNVAGHFWDAFPNEILKAKEGIVLLGAPIGKNGFIKNYCCEKIQDMNLLMEKVKSLQDPQLELILFRSCATFPKINFMLRSVDSSIIDDELKQFDLFVDQCISHILSYNLDSFSRKMWSLPMSMSGFGFPKAFRLAPAAYISSVSSTWELQKVQNISSLPNSFNSNLGRFQSYLKSAFDYDVNNPTALNQHTLKLLLDYDTKNELIEICEQYINSTNEDASIKYSRLKAILLNRSLKYCNGWLYAVPADWSGTRINQYSFRCLLKYHSGIPLADSIKACPKCKKDMDCYGDHAISCSHTSQRIARHNTLVESLKATLGKAGIACTTEQSASMKGDRMGDIVLINWMESRDAYLDLPVVNSLCPSYLPKSIKQTGGAAEVRHQEKKKKYQDVIEKNSVFFQPVIVETLGGWHESCVRLMKTFAERLANRNQTCPSLEEANLMTSLSIRLQKINGSMLASRYYD